MDGAEHLRTGPWSPDHGRVRGNQVLALLEMGDEFLPNFTATHPSSRRSVPWSGDNGPYFPKPSPIADFQRAGESRIPASNPFLVKSEGDATCSTFALLPKHEQQPILVDPR